MLQFCQPLNGDFHPVLEEDGSTIQPLLHLRRASELIFVITMAKANFWNYLVGIFPFISLTAVKIFTSSHAQSSHALPWRGPEDLCKDLCEDGSDLKRKHQRRLRCQVPSFWGNLPVSMDLTLAPRGHCLGHWQSRRPQVNLQLRTRRRVRYSEETNGGAEQHESKIHHFLAEAKRKGRTFWPADAILP